MNLIEILKSEMPNNNEINNSKTLKKRKHKLVKIGLRCWEHPHIKLVEDVPFGWQAHCPKCNHQYVHHDNIYHNYINARHPHVTSWDKDYQNKQYLY